MVDLNKVGLSQTVAPSGKNDASGALQYDNGVSGENKTTFANLDNKVAGMRKGQAQQGGIGNQSFA